MADFTLPLTAEGSVTAPTGAFTFVEPSAKSQTWLDVGPIHILEIPEFGWACADGVNPLRLVTRSAIYDAGGVAPNVALTAAGTGARATAVGTWTGQPSDGQFLGIGTKLYGTMTVIAKTTLVTDGSESADQVKIGATDDDTFTNLQKLINETGTNGTEYYSDNIANYGLGYHRDQWDDEVSAIDTTANTITVRSITYGTSGNTRLSTDTFSNFSWASGTFTGGTDGTGTAPSAGTYRYFYTWYRSTDGAETGRSPIASIDNSVSQNIALSALTASADTTFDFIRIYRTENLGVEFFLLGAVPRATTTFTDDISDTALATSAVWNDELYRAYAEGMPPRGRALALWKGSVWSLGAHLAAEYVRGTVSVTEDSATVTFSAKGVTSLMRGRTFKVAATSEEYTILSVSESGPTAVLDRAYTGTTNGTASYTIKDDYDACAIRRCVPFLYNQWPVEESPGRVDTDDAEGGTALLATKSRLFAFSRTSIVAVTGDGPESWEISKVGQGVGCVAPRMVVGVEGGGLFLSLDGFYAISPDESLACVSSPKAPAKMIAKGIDGTVARINWACVDQGYSYFDTASRTVVFGLPLDGAVTPNYEIVFDLQNGTWTTFKRAEWTAATNGTLPGGGQFILSGDRDGNLWHVDLGESDGFYGTEAVQTLTGAQTVRTLTVTGTPFSTSGDAEKGKPVIVLYANGTTVAYGKVASNTTSALTLAEDLATAPAAGDQVVLGGIAAQAKSGFPTFGEEYRSKILRSVTLRHAPISRGTYFFSFAVNGGSYALPPVGTGIGDLTETDGKVRHMTQWPGDSHSINVRRFQPGGRMTLRGGVFDIVVRENSRS